MPGADGWHRRFGRAAEHERMQVPYSPDNSAYEGRPDGSHFTLKQRQGQSTPADFLDRSLDGYEKQCRQVSGNRCKREQHNPCLFFEQCPDIEYQRHDKDQDDIPVDGDPP